MDPDVVYRFTVQGKGTVYLSKHMSGTKRLEYPEGSAGAALEATRGEMTFDPSLFPEGSRSHTLYLRSTESKQARKITVNYPCKDYVLKRKGNPEKDCIWLAGLRRRKKNKLCSGSGISRRCPATCGLCEQNIQSGMFKERQFLLSPGTGIANTTDSDGDQEEQKRRPRSTPLMTMTATNDYGDGYHKQRQRSHHPTSVAATATYDQTGDDLRKLWT